MSLGGELTNISLKAALGLKGIQGKRRTFLRRKGEKVRESVCEREVKREIQRDCERGRDGWASGRVRFGLG